MARNLILDRETDPRFSQPIRQIIAMIIVLGLVAAVIAAIYVPIHSVFVANIELTGFITTVFVVGVLSCFWQVYQLTSAVSWIEGFALDRPGHEFTRAPRLLASLSALLRGKDARRLLNPTSTRSILDSVATRLDEARDITRYIVSVLIFLGLLGTFWGLARTMPKVVEVIQSLQPQEGESGVAVFERLMTGLKGQLEGIGTAFSASLIGLASSLVVGLLDLFAGHGQNRFYRELEEWLSSITRLSVAGADGEQPASDAGALMMLVEQNARQVEAMREVFAQAEERQAEMESRLSELAATMKQVAETGLQGGGGLNGATDALERIAASQAELTGILKERDEETGKLDSETRMRLRNIDVQLLRILEEMASGRQDSISEIRSDLRSLIQAIEAATGQADER
ncbi:MAG: biopolymer transporter ExbB [Alphaproteobacteria bacterium]|nr:MAG: biopolymer transporter ExbB [Alphaproteobacteria bacterium]